VIKTKPRDLAQMHLWLQALDFVTKVDPINGRYVQQQLDVPINQINEYLNAVEYSWPTNCTPFEVLWRRRYHKLVQLRGL
jgi:hypothetical protein